MGLGVTKTGILLTVNSAELVPKTNIDDINFKKARKKGKRKKEKEEKKEKEKKGKIKK